MNECRSGSGGVEQGDRGGTKFPCKGIMSGLHTKNKCRRQSDKPSKSIFRKYRIPLPTHGGEG
jgi:hypothetical protein